MPFIPHTPEDVSAMLAAIGTTDIESLFDEIPEYLKISGLPGVPVGLSEMEVAHLMQARAKQDEGLCCFLGAGAYDHYIPAAIWEVVGRGEYMTAYTPYQAEASQGTLQLIYEYQTMMAKLTGMEVSNASLYGGASALGEAILMAIRANRKNKSHRVLIPNSVNPVYRKVATTIVHNQSIELVEVPWIAGSGTVDPGACVDYEKEGFAALVIQHPNVFGTYEDVDRLTDWAHAQGAMVIAVVNPTSLGLLRPPGQWGQQGADIVCGEGQPLGIPLSSGGPYFGFMTSKLVYVRQMPGRIIGRTLDEDGQEGFVLTLQAREQHIRRSKATSNICTNQGLMVTAATIYMSLVGFSGLQEVARRSHQNTQLLVECLTEIEGVDAVFSSPIFHEAVLRLPCAAKPVIDALAEQGILGGLDLSQWYPELTNAMLVCATEVRTADEIRRYQRVLKSILASI